MSSTAIDLLARRFAADSIIQTTTAGSGHPTSSLSAAHLMAVLFDRYLRLFPDDPGNLANDRFVLSKGHGVPILYAALASIGVVDRDDLGTLRQEGSLLEGHPVPKVPHVDAATGSLGQGLANGLGLALGLKILGSPARVWVMVGDSEMAEGSVWEALSLASHYDLTNLVAILDMNRLGQTGPTKHGRDAELYERRVSAFGWNAISVDGHDPDAIGAAYEEAIETAPAMVIASTIKGWGVDSVADAPGEHGKALSKEESSNALEQLSPPPPRPIQVEEPVLFSQPELVANDYEYPAFSETVATRDAFGKTLESIVSADPRLVVLDAEVGNSTRTDSVEEQAEDRFLQMYIAEQAMIGAATGIQALGFIPIVSTFSAFLTRAHDFLRMASISGAQLVVNGSHAGVSIGEDGPSQMGLDDIAMMRGLFGSTVLYPADGPATAALTGLAVTNDGITYLRTTREDTPILDEPDDGFEIGGSRTLRRSDEDSAAVIAAGVTVFEALEAADLVDQNVRVVDAYSIQPIDRETMRRAAHDTDRVVVVEDHGTVGGLGDAVTEAVSDLDTPVTKLGVSEWPGSASPEAQREQAGIAARAIVEAIGN
ncbi:MAG: transketolase [Actinobacteria bacterium]|nr:MAG: transketolase [Actinomycetota bacterium]REK39030.1 MAG: transketolase [Actinomycetota bacterium]